MLKVFISYSWDSTQHQDRVWVLSDRLRKNRIDCDIDQYYASPEEGWPKWMERQIREADFVLVVCTENYLRRFEGRESQGKGQGVKWESLLSSNHLYYSDSLNTKFVPLVFEPAQKGSVPYPLKGFTIYDLSLPEGYESLYRHLTNQPKRPKPALGQEKIFPPDHLPELPLRKRMWSEPPEATLQIGNITAQNGSIAIGQANHSVIQVHNTNQSFQNEAELNALETDYLHRVMSDCAGLEWLRLVRKQDEKTPAVGLDSVYTALMTESFADRDPTQRPRLGDLPRRLSALEVLNRNKRLVLTGTPGSGKSAFVNYLVLSMAGEKLGDARANFDTLTEALPDNEGKPQTQGENKRELRQNWAHGALIPVRMILRDFAVSQHFPASDQDADAKCLLNFLRADLQTKACEAFFPKLEARLRAGEALLLFDGLDEVAKAGERRKRLITCIQGFAKSFPNTRILVTCRPFAYAQEDWKLQGFGDAMLAKFERGQIIRFIERWYRASPDFESGTAQERAQKLRNAIFQRRALHALATQPLLLSLIAYLHANRHELPERRADLYERLLELLIDEWEKARFKTEDPEAARRREQHSLAEFLQLGQDTIRLVLERLAFQVHACEPRDADSDPMQCADIAAKDLSHQLLCEAKKAGRERIDALDICEFLRDRVGILYQRGGMSDLDAVYTFPHRSFQEYLAAAYLRRAEGALLKDHPDCEDWQSLAAKLAARDPDRWREVLLLAGGIRSLKESQPVWLLLDALYPESIDEPGPCESWALRFAAQILDENLERDNLTPKHARIFERIRKALPKVLTTSQLPAAERVATGKHLAVLGDPRKEITEVDSMRFCGIPAGSFWMGKGAKDDSNEAIGSESPAGEYGLDYDYWLAEYPVTLAQFGEFVENSGRRPDDEDSLKGRTNDPVVDVTWRDATEFCEWLTERWHAKGFLCREWRACLPNEPEWEKAARGGLQIPDEPRIEVISTVFSEASHGLKPRQNPNPQRRYPWGDQDITPELSNFYMNIGTVSTPGVYPNGKSPYGCQDLSGNVWEWTRSEYGDYPYPQADTKALRRRESDERDASRVLRGGAFLSAPRSVRAAVRGNRDANYRFNLVGFRVCLSPLPLNDDPLNDESLIR